MWLKIKVWTKVTIAAALLIYILAFIFKNSNQPVEFWYWYNSSKPASVFTLSTMAFAAGMVAMVLISTTWKTWSQIRELRKRNQQQKATKELAELRTKASMLQTRSATIPATSSVSTFGNGSNVATVADSPPTCLKDDLGT